MAESDAQLWAAWFDAAARAEIDHTIRRLYHELDGEVAARGPTCWQSGKCCHFDAYGHRLYVTGLEIAWVVDRLSPQVVPTPLTVSSSRQREHEQPRGDNPRQTADEHAPKAVDTPPNAGQTNALPLAPDRTGFMQNQGDEAAAVSAGARAHHRLSPQVVPTPLTVSYSRQREPEQPRGDNPRQATDEHAPKAVDTPPNAGQTNVLPLAPDRTGLGERPGEEAITRDVRMHPLPISLPTGEGAEATTPGGCPFQRDKLCTVHTIRPLGCRIFFCQAGTQDWQHDLCERYLARFRTLHDAYALPYRYLEWRTGLAAATAHPRPPTPQ